MTPLWPRGDDEWVRVLRLPNYASRQPPREALRQAPLFSLDADTEDVPDDRRHAARG